MPRLASSFFFSRQLRITRNFFELLLPFHDSIVISFRSFQWIFACELKPKSNWCSPSANAILSHRNHEIIQLYASLVKWSNRMVFFFLVWNIFSVPCAVVTVGSRKNPILFSLLTIIFVLLFSSILNVFLYDFSCFYSFLLTILPHSSSLRFCIHEHEFELSCHVISLSVRHSNKMDVLHCIRNVNTTKKNYTHSKLHWTHMEIRDALDATHGIRTYKRKKKK